MNQEHRVHCSVPKPIILKCKIFLPQLKATENLFFDNNGLKANKITKGKKMAGYLQIYSKTLDFGQLNKLEQE